MGPGGDRARGVHREPGRGRGRAYRVAHPSDQGGLLRGGQSAGLGQRGQHRELLGLPVGRLPGVPYQTTRGIRASEPLSRSTKASSGPVSAPLDRAATTVTAVSAAPCSGEASWAARSLGALAGRNEVLSLCVTLDSDGSSAMAAAAPAAQASTMAQRKRTVSRPVAAKKVPTKAIVAGRGAAPLDPGERSVSSWLIRSGTVAFRPAPGQIPDSPGVYRFRDEHGRVIYVGKAKSLRQRLTHYFPDLAGLHPRTQTMVTTAADRRVDRGPHRGRGAAARVLLIKEYRPAVQRQVPRRQELPVPRGHPERGVPAGAGDARGQAQGRPLLRPVRATPGRSARPSTCCCASSRSAPARPGCSSAPPQIGRPCLLGYIGKCSAPCVGRVTAEEHRELAEDFCDFMAGRHRPVRQAAGARDARGRRRAGVRAGRPAARRPRALQRAMEKQAVVLGDGTDADVIALAEDELEAAVQVFHVRGGRVARPARLGGRQGRGRRHRRAWSSSSCSSCTAERRGGRASLARARSWCPRCRRTPTPSPSGSAERRGGPGRAPGAAARRQEGAAWRPSSRNAERGARPAQDQARQRPDHPEQGAQEIAGGARPDEAPLRIECYDISHLQGTDVVASMVVFEDGLARKSEYRRFEIKGHDGSDDVASMHEVITRRFRRYLEERRRPASWTTLGPRGRRGRRRCGRPGRRTAQRKFAYPPNLVVVDGGQPQAAAAARALDELGIDDVAVCGLAKRLEEVWLPGEDVPGRSCRAAARGCTCCSGCGTRRTGSRSPTTGPSAPRRTQPAPWTTCPGSARRAARRCSSSSAR